MLERRVRNAFPSTQRDEDELEEDEYRLRRSLGPSFGGGEGRPRGGGEERRRGERDRRGDLKETQCG